MSEDNAIAEIEKGIDQLITEEGKPESEVESDTEAEEVTETEEVEETESASDEEKSTTEEDETKSEVEFDFHNTQTSRSQLVSNLKSLPEQERKEYISKLTRAKDIEAAKEAFPDSQKEEVPVTRKEFDALMKKIEDQGSDANTEKLQKALEIASKLQATEGLTDSRMKDLMLQERFGDSYKDVSKDPKFKAAYEKYPSLSLEERLGLACSLSPVAIKLATDSEVKKQVKLKNTKTVKKGRQTVDEAKVDLKSIDSLDKFEKLMADTFNG